MTSSGTDRPVGTHQQRGARLYGRGDSYAIAGLAAAVVAATQIAGGYLVRYVGRVFRFRTVFLIAGTVLSAVALGLIGLVSSFRAALALLAVWAIVFAATTPVRQAFINGLIPSDQRATILSSENLLASSGGVVVQPVLAASPTPGATPRRTSWRASSSCSPCRSCSWRGASTRRRTDPRGGHPGLTPVNRHMEPAYLMWDERYRVWSSRDHIPGGREAG